MKRPGRHRARARAIPAVRALVTGLIATGALASAAWPQTTAELPEAILERYTGNYRLGQLVLSVTRQGRQLYVQLTGQPSAAIYPQTASSFVYKIVDARIDFIPNPPAEITALVLHQRGNDLVAPRIDAEAARGLQAAVAQRVQNQTATPGSEPAARHLLAGLAAGAPDYATMTPALAAATREQLPTLQSTLNALGAVQSMQFEGVGNQGWDLYLVHHEHGTSQLRIRLDADGVVAGALISAGP
jgi:hypothetical protein